MADRFFIAPYDSESGLTNSVRPWLIPDTAFSEMNNAYVWRGRVRKRFGSIYLGGSDSGLESRFRINIGTTDGAGNFVGNTPVFGGSPIATPAVGQMFSIGTQVFTVNVLGNPAVMLISGSATLATFDTTTGAVIINGAALLTAVYYYPALPVMGLLTKEEANVSDEFIIGFDTRFAYQYASGWERLNGETTPGASRWIGSDTDFFWGTTWRGVSASQFIFFVTNFNPNETNFMRQFDGALWDDFRPRLDSGATTFLNSARILVVFKNRLLALNTYEGAGFPGDNFPNRCRYSQIGDPRVVDAWDQDVPGKGNAIDAPTSEAIITVEFIKDRLIVYFERSTWELIYTGNQAFPFAWQQINTELGAESTFTIIPLENQAIGIGNVGIHACNGSNVQRIDQKIPNLVFDIHNVEGGIERVYGTRDYQAETLYWSYPDTTATADQPYPTKVLVYNYRNNTWAINDDSITVFGYFQPLEGALWSSETITWADDITWGSGNLQAKQRVVVAGNQEGYTFICDKDIINNAPVLQITNMTNPANNVIRFTVINHNLRVQDYIYITGSVFSDATIPYNETIQQVFSVSDSNTFDIIGSENLTGTYKGDGRIARVSQISILTKEYNFYADSGKQALIPKIEFMVDRTSDGSIDINFYVSTNQNPMLLPSGITGTLIGTGTLATYAYTNFNSANQGNLERFSTRVWHPVFFQAAGNVIQLQIQSNDTQMRNINNSRYSDFQMHAVCISANPIGGNRLE